MPSWHLEVITPQDLDRILTIDRAAFKRTWQRKSILAELACDNAYCYAAKTQLAENRMEIIAYVFIRILVSEMHIMRIAVAAAYQSRGVATWLLQQCFKLAEQKKVAAAYIEVRPTNTTAIALYRKAGFQPLGTRPNYYPETGEDALVMVKYIKENL